MYPIKDTFCYDFDSCDYSIDPYRGSRQRLFLPDLPASPPHALNRFTSRPMTSINRRDRAFTSSRAHPISRRLLPIYDSQVGPTVNLDRSRAHRHLPRLPRRNVCTRRIPTPRARVPINRTDASNTYRTLLLPGGRIKTGSITRRTSSHTSAMR